MRRWLIGIVLVVAVAALAFFALAPGIVERGINRIDGKPLPEVSARAKALHATLTIVDLHSDTLMWKRDFLDRAERGHMDLPRLEDGHVALQVLASTTKSPKGQNYDSNSGDTDNITTLVIAQLQPVRTWNSLLERSLWHATKLHRAVAASAGKLRGVETAEDLTTLLAARRGKVPPVGAMLSVEGLHGLDGQIANLDKLYAAGFRMAGLTHFFDNDLAGSMHGLKKGGLTPFGRQVVEAMEAKGMIVDVAHCSKACVADILKMARRPIVSSHGGVQATCQVNRNLDDEQIKGVAATGGIIGIGYWDGADLRHRARQHRQSDEACPRSRRHPACRTRQRLRRRHHRALRHVAAGADHPGADRRGLHRRRHPRRDGRQRDPRAGGGAGSVDAATRPGCR